MVQFNAAPGFCKQRVFPAEARRRGSAGWVGCRDPNTLIGAGHHLMELAALTQQQHKKKLRQSDSPYCTARGACWNHREHMHEGILARSQSST